MDTTIVVARWMTGGRVLDVAADLSCGDGAIVDAVAAGRRIHGDLAPGWEVCGPIEQTLASLPAVDLYVCAETLEHVDDPDLILRLVRARSAVLVLSTPVGAWGDSNPEHLWAWDRSEVEGMLTGAGWQIDAYTAVDFTVAGLPYVFGIWGAR